MSVQQIIDELRKEGQRMTVVRRALLQLFHNAPLPLSYDEINAQLHHRNINANKATIYRELEFLHNRKIITVVHFEDESGKRYEWTQLPHHHHVRCVRCDRIADVVMNRELSRVLQKVEQQTNYTVNEHSMEFIGMCGQCRNN